MVCFLPEMRYRVISYFVSPGMRTGSSFVASCADADEQSSNVNTVDSIFICAMEVLPTTANTLTRRCHRRPSRNAASASAPAAFPDATVVTAPFGIYVADDVQKVQFVLLSNCRDETATRHALQRFIEWLDIAGEAADLVERARSRKRIVQTIAKETGVTGS
jgi:hypothetical protein